MSTRNPKLALFAEFAAVAKSLGHAHRLELLEQLAQGGRLVIPVGSRGAQFLERWQRKGASYEQDVSIPVAFVPLVGRHGWRE
jgi:protein-L-isoaspartate O-methyltransferase